MEEALRQFYDFFNTGLEDSLEGLIVEGLLPENPTELDIVKIKDTIIDRFLPSLKPYLYDETFYEYIANSDLADAFKLIMPDEYISFIDQYVLDGKSNANYIYDENEYNLLLNKGISTEDILSKFHIHNDELLYKIYKANPSLRDLVLSKSSNKYIIADLVAEGHVEYIDKVAHLYDKRWLIEFFPYLIDKKLDIEKLVIYLETHLDDISIEFTDSDAQKFINNNGPLSLIFISNINDNMMKDISYFSLDDYINYDFSYKKSSALLHMLLEEGKEEALFHTTPEAIDEEVYNYIKEHNISIDLILQNDSLCQSYYVNKYLIEHDNYSRVSRINSILSDTKSFDLVCDLIKEDKIEGTSQSIDFIKALLNNEKPKALYDYVNKDIISRLIDMGLQVEDCYGFSNSNDFYLEFIRRGNKDAIFLLDKYSTNVDEYLDSITYEDYVSFRSKHPDKKIDFDIISRLYKEGHLDVINNQELTYDYELKELGLLDLTEEQFRSLPIEVQNMRIMQEKYAEYVDINKAAKEKPTEALLDKAALNGMPYEEMMEIINEHSYISLSINTALIYLKQGYKDIINYVSNDGRGKSMELAEEYYKQANGELPPQEFFNKLSYGSTMEDMVYYYVKNGRLDILELVNYINQVNRIKELGISIDDLLKLKQVPDYLLAEYVNHDTEDKIIDYIKNSGKNSSPVVLKLLKIRTNPEKLKGLNFDYINSQEILKVFNGNLDEMLKYIPIVELLNSKLLTKEMINNIPEDMIKEALESYKLQSKIKAQIIRYKVELGYGEYIKYYSNSIDMDVLKRAILLGEVWPNEDMRNDKYMLYLKKITFTNEEKERLRSLLPSHPRLFIFFEDIINDSNKLVEYIIKCPEMTKFIKDKVSYNIELLSIINKTNPEVVASFIDKDTPKEDLVSLLLINNELIKYIPDRFISESIISSIIESNPYIIDDINKVSFNLIYQAFDNGYEVNSKSSKRVIHSAFLKHKEKDDSLVYGLGLEGLLDIAFSYDFKLIDKNDYKELFGKYFEYYINQDKIEFMYQVLLRNQKGEGIEHDILADLGVDYNKYSSIKDKESFNVVYNLEQNPDKINDISYLSNLIDSSNNKADLINAIFRINGINSETISTIANKYFECDPYRLYAHVDINSEDIINRSKKIFEYDNNIYTVIPSILDSKEFILECLNNNLDVYRYISNDEYRNDIDIIKQALIVSENNAIYIDYNNEVIDKFFRTNIEEYPFIYKYHVKFLDNKEAILKFLSYENGNAFKYLSIDSEFKYDEDICLSYLNNSNYDCSLVPSEVLASLLLKDKLDINNNGLSIFNKLNTNMTLEVRSSEQFKNLLNSLVSDIAIDNNLFKQVIEYYDIIETLNVEEEYKNVLKNGHDILVSSGKINLLDKNPVFSYKLCQYIYPLLGLKDSLDLMQYNTGAASEIIRLIENGDSEFVTSYCALIRDSKIYADDNKFIHYIFRHISSYEDLAKDLVNNQDRLDKSDFDNLKKIITNSNYYAISNIDELKRYEQIVKDKVDGIRNGNNTYTIKDLLAHMFGFNSIIDLTKNFNSYDLDNFIKYNYIKNELRSKLGQAEGEKKWDEVFFNNKEITIILLVRQIIEINDQDELKELLDKFIGASGDVLDFCDDYDAIISKIRNLYNLEYNLNLTKIEELKSPRTEKDGVTIIDMNAESFNFLAHRIFSYDQSMGGFKQMLIDDPSLWTKLDGASTLSTSSFSDKGFWFLDSGSNSGVVYLFNNLPPQFMLFMYGRDLFVEHGGHKIEPTANSNSFTDINALNMSSNFHHGDYNEVAGFRDGMMPCAIACTGNEPTEDQKRAAIYFGIPIIRFDINAYDKQVNDNREQAKNSIIENLNSNNTPGVIKAIDDIIFNTNNKVTENALDEVEQSISYIIDSVNKKYQNGELETDSLLQILTKLEVTINRIKCDNKRMSNELRKVTLLKQAICIFKSVTHEKIVSIENAKMGESGIMYKYKEGDQIYLVKPAVDKQEYKPQPFRAEIQKAASKLQRMLSSDTAVDVDVIGSGPVRFSKQALIDTDSSKTNMLEEWTNNPDMVLDEKYADALLKEYVIDFLLCNFDAFAGNFIIDSNGNLRGVDKEQSFRFINDNQSLDPSFSYVPNGNSRIPIYKILFDRYREGKQPLNLDVIYDTIETVKLINDDEYKELFSKYAEGLNPNRKEEILDTICKRKHEATNKIIEYIDSINPELELGEVVNL